jgi:hypothetical protein
MRTRPALTGCFYPANVGLYNPQKPQFNVFTASSVSSERESESESESDNPVTERKQAKLDEILKRGETEEFPIMPSDSDDPEAQEKLILEREQKRPSRLAKRRLKREEKKSSMTPSGSDNRAKEAEEEVTTYYTNTKLGSSSEFGESDRLAEFSQESEEDAFSQEKQAEQASSSQQNTEKKPTHKQSAPSGVPSNPNTNPLNLEQTRRIMMSL